MITLPRDPYWTNAEAHFYQLQCKRFDCIIRKSDLYYEQYKDWLKEEYCAEYWRSYDKNMIRKMIGFNFESENHRTFFALKWS